MARLEGVAFQPLEPLWADETALQLVADVLEAAFARHGLPAKKRRIETEAEHAELAEAVKSLLAKRLGERITLEEISRALEASPFHLARVFQTQTGVPVHRYLSRLRLRTVLDRLEAGARDLTGAGFRAELLQPQSLHRCFPPRIRLHAVQFPEGKGTPHSLRDQRESKGLIAPRDGSSLFCHRDFSGPYSAAKNLRKNQQCTAGLSVRLVLWWLAPSRVLRNA